MSPVSRKAPTGLLALALALAIMEVVVGVSYLGPDSWVHQAAPEGQRSIVQYIESIAPIWPALFLGSGIFLVVAAMTERLTVYAHAVAAATWAAYGAALTLGPLLTLPPLPILTGEIAVFLVPVHLACITLWKEHGVE